MSGFPIIDLVVGLIFIFFILSIITSSIVEVALSRYKVRNKFLAQWLLTTFDGKIKSNNKEMMLGQAIMDHDLTAVLSDEGESTSFMDAKNFVSVLIEKLTFDPEKPDEKVIQNLDELLAKIENCKSFDNKPLLSTELRRTILIFGSEAKIDALAQEPPAATVPIKSAFQLFRKKLENWFDTSMERVTGKMKSTYARPLTFWFGLLVVVALNVDTIQISKYLYDNKAETKQFADQALASIKKIDTSKSADVTQNIAKMRQDFETLKSASPKDMPLGWSKEQVPDGVLGALGRLVGWFATVMAIMLGAPFWFDLLNKISNIRGSGSKPQLSADQDNKEK